MLKSHAKASEGKGPQCKTAVNWPIVSTYFLIIHIFKRGKGEHKELRMKKNETKGPRGTQGQEKAFLD